MEENQQIVFNIKLNIDQVNVILSTMGKLPYESISPLMHSIQAQANMQMQEITAQREKHSDQAAQ
jgi:uncharacterized membrane protein